MSKLIRIALIVVILACLGSGYLAYRLDTMKKQHLAKIDNLTSTLNTTSNTLVRTEQTLDQTKADLATTRNDLATTKADLQARSVELAQRTEDLNATKTKLAETEDKLQAASTELVSAKESIQKMRDSLRTAGVEDITDIDALVKKVTTQAKENEVLGEQLEKFKQENTELAAQIAQLSTTPIPLRGRIVGVRQDWNFVVIDLGKNDRVQTNTQFLVYRDSQFVSKLKITAVDANTSVGEILPDYRKSTPREGDLVVH